MCCPNGNILQSNNIKIRPRSSTSVIMLGSSIYSEIEMIELTSQKMANAQRLSAKVREFNL